MNCSNPHFPASSPFQRLFQEPPAESNSSLDNPAGGDGRAEIRQACGDALAIPNTGLAVTIDVGGMNTGGLSFSDSDQMYCEQLMGLFHEWHLRIQQDYQSRGVTLPYDVNVKNQATWSYEAHVAQRVTNAMLTTPAHGPSPPQARPHLHQSESSTRKPSATAASEPPPP